MSQMLHEITEMVPKEVMVMNDQEVVIELKEDTLLKEVSKEIHWLFYWGNSPLVFLSQL